MNNAWRWGLVTFCGCITCAVIGQYVSALIAVLLAIVVSALGALSINFGEEK